MKKFLRGLVAAIILVLILAGLSCIGYYSDQYKKNHPNKWRIEVVYAVHYPNMTDTITEYYIDFREGHGTVEIDSRYGRNQLLINDREEFTTTAPIQLISHRIYQKD